MLCGGVVLCCKRHCVAELGLAERCKGYDMFRQALQRQRKPSNGIAKSTTSKRRQCVRGQAMAMCSAAKSSPAKERRGTHYKPMCRRETEWRCTPNQCSAMARRVGAQQARQGNGSPLISKGKARSVMQGQCKDGTAYRRCAKERRN